MSNTMCDIFDIPHLSELDTVDSDIGVPASPDEDNQSCTPVITETKIDDHSAEMDEIYSEAMRGYRDLYELSLNIEPTKTGSIAETAVHMLGIALAASKSKNEQRIKSLRYGLEKERSRTKKKIDNTEQIETNTPDKNGATIIANRNDLIKMLKNQDK